MKSLEKNIGETMMPNQKTGREFLVRFFMNSYGYSYNCGICNKTAVYRMEIYNHLFEPQGSEYYCMECTPPIPRSETD